MNAAHSEKGNDKVDMNHFSVLIAVVFCEIGSSTLYFNFSFYAEYKSEKKEFGDCQLGLPGDDFIESRCILGQIFLRLIRLDVWR